MGKPGTRDDWRDPRAYASLPLARDAFAWEWLRRNSAYRVEAQASLAGQTARNARHWGLHQYIDPDLPAPDARPVWTRAAFGGVLMARARRSAGTRGFDLTQWADRATLVRERHRSHLLLSDGTHCIRLDIGGAPVTDGAVTLTFVIEGPGGLAMPLLALSQFETLTRLGRFSPQLQRTVARAAREVLLLRTADALDAGAGLREIAAVLLDPAAAGRNWRYERPDLRSRVQRLAREARARQPAGYRAFLEERPGETMRFQRPAAALPT